MHFRAIRRSSGQPVPSVPAGSLIYAVGDIHGRADLLAHLLTQIEDSARSSVARRRVVLFLGDYVDRGPDSRAVLQRLIDGPPPGWQWIFLRGNHEDMMLHFLGDLSYGPAWLRNGGLATIDAYAGTAHAGTGLDGLDPSALQELLLRHLPPAHRDFLADLPCCHGEGDYFFVHAGVRPGVPLERQQPEDMVWIRGPFLRSAADHGKIIVHGHTIAAEPEVCANRIGIDTGAYASGRLTALMLEGRERRFLHT